jgi:hypothetical protein
MFVQLRFGVRGCGCGGIQAGMGESTRMINHEIRERERFKKSKKSVRKTRPLVLRVPRYIRVWAPGEQTHGGRRHDLLEVPQSRLEIREEADEDAL